MRALIKWIALGLLAVPPVVACSSKPHLGDDGSDDSDASAPDDDATTTVFGGDSGSFDFGDGGSTESQDSKDCKGGFYKGTFEGLYSSGIIGIFFKTPDGGAAINLPVIGDVQLTLQQTGSGEKNCVFEGESEKCSNFFTLQNGTISGTADGLFPYFCKMSGTLNCKDKKLVDGCIQCVYCVGFPVADGGNDCVFNTPLSEGKFAGPLTVDYFYASGDAGPSFGTAPLPGILDGLINTSDAGKDPGLWNGAESLAGYSGTGPVPGGGKVSDHISDAGYGRIGVTNDYGGFGFWNAFYSPDGG